MSNVHPKTINIPKDILPKLRVLAAKKGMPLNHYIVYYLELHVKKTNN